ncbi:MAG: LysM peptidoglycan-binding domain-containing protein [Deltaproteobacteria bacterium]|nr:LysM peptidoglycan-binding domain-containing protein [Deltaproteobacteria bacterium]
MVRSGDSVSVVAERFGMRSAQLRAINNLTDDKIRIGQRLNIPVGLQPRETASASSSASSSQAAADGETSTFRVTPVPADGWYEVQAGDSVSEIAERFGLKSDRIRELNKLADDRIRSGQRLRLSSRASSVQAQAPPASGNYVVKSGDSVSVIAERFGLRSAELRQLNNLSDDKIKIGQTLRVKK